MKKLITLLVLVVVAMTAAAQMETTKTIRGAVVDKNGNPLPGAVVSAEGGAETTIVESDGTFTLEVPVWLKKVSATYAGYSKRKLNTNFNEDMIFHLRTAKTGGYFLNAVFGLSIDIEYGDVLPYVALRGGYLGNWGWYAEAGYDNNTCLPEIIVGAIRRLKGNNFLYLGAGYGGVTYYSYSGMAFDMGYQVMIGRHFDLSVGFTITTNFCCDMNIVPKLSAGYVF